mgnify:FL=1
MSTQPQDVNPLSCVANNRRLVLEALCQITAPADRKRIAGLAGGLDENTVGMHLVAMVNEGLVERIDQPKGKAALWQLVGNVKSIQRPTATDGEPGDGSPGEDHEDEETAACAEPDDFRDGDDRPAAADDAYGLDYDPRVAEAEAVAYDALVEAEAAADEAPLAGEDVNGEADVLKDRCERYTDPVEAAADQIAAAVAAGQCPTVGLLGHARPVAAEAMRRAIDDAEVEALMREEEAGIALEMARDARVRGRAVAEIIRFADQRTGLAGDADPGAVLAAIVELLDGARSAVTGMSRPA